MTNCCYALYSFTVNTRDSFYCKSHFIYSEFFFYGFTFIFLYMQ